MPCVFGAARNKFQHHGDVQSLRRGAPGRRDPHGGDMWVKRPSTCHEEIKGTHTDVRLCLSCLPVQFASNALPSSLRSHVAPACTVVFVIVVVASLVVFSGTYCSTDFGSSSFAAVICDCGAKDYFPQTQFQTEVSAARRPRAPP